MNTKYNGFNNGRDTSDGIGGNPAYEGMNTNQTPEESFCIYLTEMGIGYKQRELIIKRFNSMAERIKELEKSLESVIKALEICTTVIKNEDLLETLKTGIDFHKQLLNNKTNKEEK